MWLTAVLQRWCPAYNRIYITSSSEKNMTVQVSLPIKGRILPAQSKLIFTQKNSIENSREMDSNQLQSPERKGFIQSSENSLVVQRHSSSH